MQASELNDIIIASLTRQGFVRTADGIAAPQLHDKSAVRDIHAIAIQHKRQKVLLALGRDQERLKAQFATSHEVEPSKITPELVEVLPNSDDELLFRFATLQWSVPVSSGYGRRLRFLVRDRNNGKLIGLIGLGDPIYSLRSRDEWIGWTPANKKLRLRHVMDAFVLGAVRPYSDILCGKLVAMLVASSEIQETFLRKYANRSSLISQTAAGEPLALVTTLSALGRSSIYNRLRLNGTTLYNSVGYSSGSGEFHFSNGTYQALFAHVKENGSWSAKHDAWGTGARNRREVIRKGLQMLSLPESLLYHGVKREVYVIPVSRNARSFLMGQTDSVDPLLMSSLDIFREFSNRWLFREGIEMRTIRPFEPADLTAWPHQCEDDRLA